jgi:hypothetical protein
MLGLYGDRKVFEGMLRRGYKEVAFGGGPWVGSTKLVGVYVFRGSPTGEVGTLQTWKSDFTGSTTRGSPTEVMYKNDAELQKLLAENRVTLGQPGPLGPLMEAWDV